MSTNSAMMDRSTSDFILHMELTAKSIIKSDNKKKRELARMERLASIGGGHAPKLSSSASKVSMSKSGSVVVDTGAMNLTMKDDSEQAMLSYSVPNMTVTMDAVTAAAGRSTSGGGQHHMRTSRSAKSLTKPKKSTTLKPIQVEPAKSKVLHDLKKSPLFPTDEHMLPKELKALFRSINMPGAGSIDSMQATDNKSTRDAAATLNADPTAVHDSVWNLKRQASNILSGNMSLRSTPHMDALTAAQYNKTGNSMGASKRSATGTGSDSEVKQEHQGPTDFSIYGLKSKYRGEYERETAWKDYQAAHGFSHAAFEDEDFVIPVASVERHPLYVLYDELILKENLRAYTRLKSRLSMKRFVMDVHELWLTNLQHIREHQPARILNDDIPSYTHANKIRNGEVEVGLGLESASMNQSGSRGSVGQGLFGEGEGAGEGEREGLGSRPMTGVSVSEAPQEEGDGSGSRHGAGETTAVMVSSEQQLLNAEDEVTLRGHGIKNRRDQDAIMGMSSQIPSVSHKRAMEKAYFTTKFPEPKVVLDYVPGSTADTKMPPICPPRIENLVSGKYKGTDLILSIDRLLVPVSYDTWEFTRDSLTCFTFTDDNDERNISTVTSWWRITLYRCTQIMKQVYIATEADIISAVSKNDGTGVGGLLADITDMEQDNHALMTSGTGKYDVRTVGNHSGVSEILSEELAAVSRYLEEVFAAESNTTVLKYDQALKSLPLSSDDAVQMAMYIMNNGLALNDELLTREASSALGRWLNFDATVNNQDNSTFIDAELLHLVFHYIPHSELKKNFNKLFYCDWEKYIEQLCFETTPTASLLASKTLQFRNNTVPGSCPYGRRGLWFSYHSHIDVAEGEGRDKDGHIVAIKQLEMSSRNLLSESNPNYKNMKLLQAKQHEVTEVDEIAPDFEHTQVSANFFRDKHLSVTDSILVNLTLALDTPILFPSVFAWEGFNIFPSRAPAEEVVAVIPTFAPKPKTLLSEATINPLECRLSYLIANFSSIAEEGIDFQPLDNPRKPPGFCRHWPNRNNYGFRRKVEIALLGVDPVLPTIAFGVTKAAAQVNSTGVNTRNIWHSTLAITEHIARPRNAKDYEYIIRKEIGCGANEPAAYAVQNRGGEYFCLQSSAFTVYEKEYEAIKERRAAFARQLALNNKIEQCEVNLKARDKAMSSMMRSALQRQVEKKMRKATRSEIGWKSRFLASIVIEVQGNWEQRRDERNNAVFFRQIPRNYEDDIESVNSLDSDHAAEEKIKLKSEKAKIKEKYLETCQWEVPSTWDGDPLGRGDGPNLGRNVMPLVSSNQQILNSGASFSSGASLGGVSGLAEDGGFDYGGDAFAQPGETWIPGEIKPDSKTASVQLRKGKELTSRYLLPRNSARREDDHDMGMGIPVGLTGGGKGRDNMSTVAGWSTTQESAAPTIDTRNLEHIAEQLVSSDELLRVLARRLGLNEEAIVPVDELGSIFSTRAGGIAFDQSNPKEVPPGPRNLANEDGQIEDEDLLVGQEHDSDNDEYWSDDEDEAGDLDEDENMGANPQSWAEMAQMKRNNMKSDAERDVAPVPKNVPFLNLAGNNISSKETQQSGDKTLGWRRLPRPDITKDFFAKFKTHTLGPSEGACNTYNSPIFLLPISPVDACQYDPEEFEAHIESIFIPNAKKDMERAIATVERNVAREEKLAANVPTDDLLLFGEAKGTTSAEAYLAAQAKEEKNIFVDPAEAAYENAILAAKASNVAQMEDSLEENISVNIADKYGNSLFILACQQGSKKMVKLLLRRGAYMDQQNLAGNTGLHYCFAYSHKELGDYLISKGANDEILNMDGLTCYEGLGDDQMNDRDHFD